MRPIFLGLLLTMSLTAQSPGERVNNGFKTLGTGGWSDAFLEWEKQSLGSSKLGLEPRQMLEEWIPKTWSIGNWELFQNISVSKIWQRQLWIATFDSGVVFFAFDFVLHKGEWRIFNLSVSKDPKSIAPNLDIYAVMTSRFKEH